MISQMSRPLLRIYLATTTLGVFAIAFAGCAGPKTSTEVPADTRESQSSPKPTPRNAFERDLQYLRNGQYTYVWIFARKDGKPLDKEDGDYLRKNAPQVVDWVTTDEGKKVIGGTNFDLEKGKLELLKKRFVIEDYSAK